MDNYNLAMLSPAKMNLRNYFQIMKVFPQMCYVCGFISTYMTVIKPIAISLH